MRLVARVAVVRPVDERAEQVHDRGLGPALLTVVHEPLQDAGGHDAAAAHQHRAGLLDASLVDVLVRLVGVDDVAVVVVLGAVALQLRQVLQAGVADGDVHELGPERDPLGAGQALGRRQDDEVAAAVAPPHDAHQTLHQHLGVADPLELPLQGLEHLAGLRRVVVVEDRLGEDVDQLPGVLGADRLAQRVGREPPDVVGPRRRVGPQPLAPRDLGDPGEVLVGAPRVVEGRQHPHLVGGDAGDPEVVERDEAADAAAHRHERHVVDGDAGAADHFVGPEVAVEQLVVEIAGHWLRRQVVRQVRRGNHARAVGIDHGFLHCRGRSPHARGTVLRVRRARNATPAGGSAVTRFGECLGGWPDRP